MILAWVFLLVKRIFYFFFGENMSIYENVKNLCKQRGIGVTTLEEKLGYGRGAIGKWRTAKKLPPADKIQQVADFFNVPYSHILNGTPDFFEETPAKQRGLIPIVGMVAAGQPITAVEEIIGYEEIGMLMSQNGDYFALKIKGESMSPDMRSGDIAIVKQQLTVEENDIAVVMVNGDEATVKLIRFDKDGLTLVPLNKDYEPMHYTAQEIINLPVKIVGKVVEVRRKY